MTARRSVGQRGLEPATTPKVRPITIDVHISDGAPCLRGTEVTTQSVGVSFAAGHSIQELAMAYGVGVHTVEAALRFELGSPAQRSAAVTIADAGPILLNGTWRQLDSDTLRWG